MTEESGSLTRREALRVAGIAGVGLLTSHGVIAGADAGQRVAIVFDPGDPVAAAAPVQWACGQLRDVLAARGVTARACRQLNEVAAGEMCVVAGSSASLREVLARSGRALPKDPEALLLSP